MKYQQKPKRKSTDISSKNQIQNVVLCSYAVLYSKEQFILLDSSRHHTTTFLFYNCSAVVVLSKEIWMSMTRLSI